MCKKGTRVVQICFSRLISCRITSKLWRTACIRSAQVRNASGERPQRKNSQSRLPAVEKCSRIASDRAFASQLMFEEIERMRPRLFRSAPVRNAAGERPSECCRKLIAAIDCRRAHYCSLFLAQGPACKAPRKCILLRLSEKETTAFSTLTQHGICTKIYHEITLVLKTCY